MDAFSQRLKDQRSQLKLTQEEFATACGVKRRAQAAYEAGERVPDLDYLVRAGRLGADLKYLMTGIRATDAEREKLAVEWLLREVCNRLGVPPAVADACLSHAVGVGSSPPDGPGKALAMQGIADDLLRRSPRLNAKEVQGVLDRDLLSDVVREQEAAWQRMHKEPSAVQKSHRFATLYEDAARTGKLNADLVEGGVVSPVSRGKAA